MVSSPDPGALRFLVAYVTTNKSDRVLELIRLPSH